MATIIIGGGIIGLSIAWQLQKAGLPITLIDDNPKGNTSSIAAGMLAPYAEAEINNPNWLTLTAQSLRTYPRFVEELKRDSGLNIPFKKTGTLLVGVDFDDTAWLNHIYKQKCQQKIEAHFLTLDQAREKEPLLSPKVIRSLWIKEDAQIATKQLMEALKKAFCQQGGTYLAPLSVFSICSHKGNVVGVQTTNQNEFPATRVIICAGAYSARFGVKTRPIKGEILTLHSPYPLQCMLRSPRVYLTSQPNNLLRVGATQMEKGYEITFSALSMRLLLQEGWEILPALDEMEIQAFHTGLRPYSDHNLPIIEEGSTKGIYYATGHGRAGLLLAPYTANLMKEKILCKS